MLSLLRGVLRAVSVVLALLMVAVAGVVGYGAWVLLSSRPRLEGGARIAGLSAPVSITRDAAGLPTITAANRLDMARALGFLHGQERFFQMDLLRRAGSGELAALVGTAAMHVDERRRLHRFRARAEKILAGRSTGERSMEAAYAQGVNAGLAALGHAPWEYTLLRVAPTPWTEADTAMVVYAMYFDLQTSDAGEQLTAAASRDVLGPALADFLTPSASPNDAPLDGSVLSEPAMPASLPALIPPTLAPPTLAPPTLAPPTLAPGSSSAAPKPPENGSNNFAVAGRLTATGSAMVASDMHLGLRVPNIWYRARMRLADASLDLVGVTLPGVPAMVVGSNTHIAWAFTDSYIDTGDAILLDPVGGDPAVYATPQGPKRMETTIEKICAAHAGCHDLIVQETLWGPVVAHDPSGRPVVWRWVAHDDNAVTDAGFLGLERATTVREALDAAHLAGMPQQNLVTGDSAGHIGWTVIGQVPRHSGTDQVPHSWADGTHGWQGYLSPSEIPEIVDPPSGRLWTANGRVVGGPALEKLGDAGYADGLRASRIRDDLAVRERFAETDFLAIQTDDRAAVLDPWQKLLLQAIAAHGADQRVAAMRPYVEAWGGRAVPASVGYRLVHGFRAEALKLVFSALTEPVAARLGAAPPIPSRSTRAVERLLTQRPAALVPPPYKDWDAVTGAVLGTLADTVAKGGGLERYTWGVVNHVGIHHPIAANIALLGLITDPPDIPMAGDTVIPRVATPGFGASERLVVSPGHEATGLLEMPMGQAGNPLVPYYAMGQKAWVDGTAAPLMPAATKWILNLTP